MRRVRLRVLERERVGEIRIEQDVLAGDLDEEAALAEPPDVHPGLRGRGMDLCDQVVAGEEGSIHSGGSSSKAVSVVCRGVKWRHGQRLGGTTAECGEQAPAGRRAGREERVGIVGHGCSRAWKGSVRAG